MTQVADEKTHVKGAEDYLASVRDGRQVFYQGEQVEDVATHPATGRGVMSIADIYEDQLRPETQDLLTYVRDDGARGSLRPISYRAPRQTSSGVARASNMSRARPSGCSVAAST